MGTRASITNARRETADSEVESVAADECEEEDAAQGWLGEAVDDQPVEQMQGEEGPQPALDEANGGDGGEPRGHAPPGSHVVDSNGYFTFTSDPHYPDVKVHVIRRWCVGGELGTQLVSKRVVCAHFGETKRDPRRSFWVLRAWMLQRCQFEGWHSRKVSRQRWWRAQEEKLRVEIQENGGVGNAAAEARIREWAPSVLP